MQEGGFRNWRSRYSRSFVFETESGTARAVEPVQPEGLEARLQRHRSAPTFHRMQSIKVQDQLSRENRDLRMATHQQAPHSLYRHTLANTRIAWNSVRLQYEAPGSILNRDKPPILRNAPDRALKLEAGIFPFSPAYLPAELGQGKKRGLPPRGNAPGNHDNCQNAKPYRVSAKGDWRRWCQNSNAGFFLENYGIAITRKRKQIQGSSQDQRSSSIGLPPTRLPN